MRIGVFLATLLALALGGYVAINAYFLARSTADMLGSGSRSASFTQITAPTDPRAIGYRGDPLTALGLPFQAMMITNPLGPAEAWLIPPSQGERGHAIFVHGVPGAREDGYRHVATLHEAGFSVLLISYRNDPDAPTAPGGSHGFGLQEWPDLEAAVAQMAPAADSPPVLVLADTMGAAILGQFLAQSPLAPRVSAIVLDSPSLSFSAVLRQSAAEAGHPLPSLISPIAGLILPRLTGIDLAGAEVAEVFEAFPGPLFIAHGEADSIVPFATSEALAEARVGQTQTFWTSAGPLGSYAEDPQGYEAALAAFLATLP